MGVISTKKIKVIRAFRNHMVLKYPYGTREKEKNLTDGKQQKEENLRK